MAFTHADKSGKQESNTKGSLSPRSELSRVRACSVSAEHFCTVKRQSSQLCATRQTMNRHQEPQKGAKRRSTPSYLGAAIWTCWNRPRVLRKQRKGKRQEKSGDDARRDTMSKTPKNFFFFLCLCVCVCVRKKKKKRKDRQLFA